MKFLCVCYYDSEAFARLTPADLEKLGEIRAPHDRALKASGKVRFVGSLGMPQHFKTLRADGNGVRLSNGPYAETKEPFGAFFMVEAGSIDEAVEVARLHPGTHVGDLFAGGIEVRPVEMFELL
jgi:hypothetical protein